MSLRVSAGAADSTGSQTLRKGDVDVAGGGPAPPDAAAATAAATAASPPTRATAAAAHDGSESNVVVDEGHAKPPPPLQQQPLSQKPSPSSRLRVLVVDDSAMTRKVCTACVIH